MSDEISTGVPIDAPTTHTHEVNSQLPAPEKPAEAKVDAKPADAKVEKSAGDAVRRAMETLKAKEAEKAKGADVKPEAKAEPKPVDAKVEAKPATDRGPDGKFAPKESTATSPVEQRTAQEKPEGVQTSEGRKPYTEAPARFNDTGKRDWVNAPDSVKEEVHRVISENEKGIQKYKESADRYEKVREFDDLARKNGREGVHESLKQVVEIEQAFQRNPIEGLKKVTDHFGINLQAVAAHIVGQNPNQQVAEAHSRVRELEGEIARMKEEARAPQIVQEFFEGHEDAKDYADDIAFVLKNGIVGDLEAAYEYVKRFKPASNAGSGQALIPPESAAAHTPAPALNPAGSKSVSGAPAGGISPASKQPVSKSNADAVKRAMAKLRA
jgi:hypothetical protein